METYKEVKELLLGELSVAYYIAAFIFSFLAIILSLYLQSNKRDPQSQSTPQNFSIRFMLWDNFKRISTGMIVLFLIYRFASVYLAKALSMEMAVAIGFVVSFGVDRMILWMMNRTNLFNMPRDKYMQKLADKEFEQPKLDQ